MIQFSFDLPEDAAAQVQQRAQRMHLSVSRYLALVVQRDLKTGWPEDYFELFGSCADAPLERPEQGEHPVREAFR